MSAPKYYFICSFFRKLYMGYRLFLFSNSSAKELNT
jgi:hypothetical protein